MKTSLARVLLAGSLALVLSLQSRAQAETDAPDSEPAPTVATFPEYGLTVTIPPLEGLKEQLKPTGRVKAVWRGKLGGTRLSIQLTVLDNERFGFTEPDDVTVVVGDNVARDKNSTFKQLGARDGPYGYAPYAALASSARHLDGSTKPDMNSFYLCGLLEHHGYIVEVDCRPALEGDAADPIMELLTQGVVYQGVERVNEWTDEQALERFLKDAPERSHDDFEKIVRTEHYIVLTSSSGGKKFAQKMEEGYDKIRKIFPFEDVAGRKLMPIFLFQTNEEYYDFTSQKTGWSRERAAGTKGHAYMDYYATWYEAPADPVHVHEATHQIFKNRLGLNGGGSWFQEGVAEYVETRKNDRNAVATQVKKGRHRPLREFMVVQTLAFDGEGDVRGGNPSGDLYKQAALFIEFMRESRFGKQHFDEFIHTMGKVNRGDIESIEAVFQNLYGVDIAELDLEFQKYCKKR